MNDVIGSMWTEQSQKDYKRSIQSHTDTYVSIF